MVVLARPVSPAPVSLLPWCSLAVTDSRNHPPALERLREELPDAALFLEWFQCGCVCAAERLIISPGVSLREPLIQQALAQAYRCWGYRAFSARWQMPLCCDNRIKRQNSTVTSLLGDGGSPNIRVKVGGNIEAGTGSAGGGRGALWRTLSFQLETTRSLKPKAATVLNLVPDHLDRYPTITPTLKLKRKIYKKQEQLCSTG